MLPRHKHNLAKLLLTNLLVKTKKGLHLQHLFAQMRDDSYYEFTFIINICPISESLPNLWCIISTSETGILKVFTSSKTIKSFSNI